MKWPFVSRKKYETDLAKCLEYQNKKVSEMNHWRNKFLNCDAHARIMSDTVNEYIRLRTHVSKYAPHALKKRNHLGQFTGESF